MPITLTPNMNLPVPVVGQEVGPQWATDINGCMTILDGHTHSAGSGTQITPSGLNLNSDVSLINNNLTIIRSSRYQVQALPLALPADVGAVYVSGVDLYYNDVNGIQIRLTQAGNIVGTAGSITGLVAPASASYNSFNGTFVFQQNVNTAANIDVASVIIRKTTVSSAGITLQAPASLAADYSIVLPILPSVLALMTLDAAGNMGTLTPSSTIGISAGTLIVNPASIADAQITPLGITAASIANNTLSDTQIVPLGITAASIADSTITPIKMSTNNYSIGATISSASTGNSVFTSMGSSTTLTPSSTSFRLIIIHILPTLGGGTGQSGIVAATNAEVAIFKDGVLMSNPTIVAAGSTVPASSIAAYDIPSSIATITYDLRARVPGGGLVTVQNCNLVAYEL